ncbi:hypothetical protein RFI_26390, partial [Reticulomyxa filosa]
EQLKSQIQMNENNSILMNENISLKKEISQLQQDIIQSNSNKDNEIKKIEKEESPQELLKLRADIEIMEKDFIKKEKHYSQSIKSLHTKKWRLIRFSHSNTKFKNDVASSLVGAAKAVNRRRISFKLNQALTGRRDYQDLVDDDDGIVVMSEQIASTLHAPAQALHERLKEQGEDKL